MKIRDITERISSMDGVLVLQPHEGDGSPEIAWGDLFFYYAPDGAVPKTQPFATIVIKDYPGDDTSRLDRPGAFRLNIAAGAEEFRRVVQSDVAGEDDTVIAHPLYAQQYWVAVVNPGPRTATAIEELLENAYRVARERFQKRKRSTHGGASVG